MNLSEPLTATTVAVTLSPVSMTSPKCPRHNPAFSSGVVLMVEEYNPPCGDQSLYVAEQCLTKTGERRRPRRFPRRQILSWHWWVLSKCPA